jgi:hypothetical protein
MGTIVKWALNRFSHDGTALLEIYDSAGIMRLSQRRYPAGG